MSVAFDMAAQPASDDAGELKVEYLQSLRLVERLHRLLLDVIKAEFDRLGLEDINSVQALLLYNIGDCELTAGELKSRGYYLGSNVSYNLKKLVESGYIVHQRSKTDRRSVRIRLSEKGMEACGVVNGLYERQLKSLTTIAELNHGDFAHINRSLTRLERYWTDQIRYRL